MTEFVAVAPDGRTSDPFEDAVFNTLDRMNDYLAVVDEKPGNSQAEPRWFK